ncbi:MAG TPA: BON domain-containing protein [Candidatus Angelobacter sp.]|nr:BON domain-containing protein [Candidatus Angelobacter sp.]
MRKRVCNLTLLLALGTGLAAAQTMPRQQPPNQTPPTLPDNQQPATGVQTHIPPADPAAVQTGIQSALQQEPSLAGSNINVQVNDKDIELTGSVPNKDAKKTAERIAKDHSGGMDIKNHIKIEKGTGMGDQANPKTPDHSK